MATPTQQIEVQSWLGDNMVYGDAVPIVITFSPVGDNERAAVQKRLSVTSTPAQVGAWSWVSATEIHWRPKALWQPGTKFFANIQTGGVPMGDGYYGQDDLTVSRASPTPDVDRRRRQDAQDDRLGGRQGRQDVPASMGKKSTPSSSGKLVIMSRKPSEEFDSSLGTGGTPVTRPAATRNSSTSRCG